MTMDMDKGVQRWIVDISKWDPSPLLFSSALSLLPPHEHPLITRKYDETMENSHMLYMICQDRGSERALVSRLLQYALVHEVFGIPYDEIVIKRTSEGKPYLECSTIALGFPNFNFNVSHHGDYVAIACEPLCLVGVDVVCCIKPQKETISEFIQSFTSYFSSFEWENIIHAGTYEDILKEFYRYWSLKEAYVKATGSGLTNGLDKVEFHHTNWNNIHVQIDGKPLTQWRFWLFELQNSHWVSVARGHPKSAAESFKRVISQTDFDEALYQKSLYLPDKGFDKRTVEQLIHSFKLHRSYYACAEECMKHTNKMT